MRLLRIGLCALAAVAGLLVLAAVVAFNTGLQTRWARRILADDRWVRGSVDRVAIGFSSTEIRDLRLEADGAVLSLPLLQAELPVVAAAGNHQVLVHRLTAKGWTLDLSRPAAGRAAFAVLAQSPAVNSGSAPLVPTPSVPGPGGAAAALVFGGIFQELRLPVDLALDGVDLEGEVILPPAPGQAPLRVHVTITGGGLGSGQEGRFTFAARAASPGDLPVNSLAVEGVATAAMDTPRSFTRLALRVTADAAGPKLRGGVRLAADLGAVRQNEGETYTATLVGGGKELAAVMANYPTDTRRLTGTWKVDLSDDDLSPFALGRVLPVFAAAGAGKFDTDVGGQDVHVSGSLNAVLDRLADGRSRFTESGSLRLAADFDVTRRRTLLRVDRLAATISRTDPILVVRSLQPFAFDVGSGELQVADATHDLLGLALHGLPLSWLEPWTHGLGLSGDPLHGEFVASARRGGLSLSSRSPLTVDRMSLDWAGQALCRDAVLALGVTADYTPEGWQVEISDGTLSREGATVLELDGKIGRLAGTRQPIKVAGHVAANLPAVLEQPAFDFLAVASPDPEAPTHVRSQLALTGGKFTGDFTGSVGAASAVQMKLTLADLVANRQITWEALPSISAELRADLSSDGKFTFRAPLAIEREGRRSDLTLAGTVGLALTGLQVDAQATSDRLVVGDVGILAAPFAAAHRLHPPEASPLAPATAVSSWGRVVGEFKLALKKIEFGEFVLDDGTGKLDVDSRAIVFSDCGAALGDGGKMKLNGRLDFAPGGPAPYGVTADFTATDFDPAGLFHRANPDAQPTIEGKFGLAGHVTGQGSTLAEAAARAQGECQVTSKGGVFRALSTVISAPAASGGKAAVIGALLGDVASAVGDVLSRRKGGNDFANAAQAIGETAKDLSSISYDQLSLTLSRDATLDTVFKDLALISPDLRLQGGGRVTYQDGTPFLNQPLALELKLDARGKLGEALKYAGILAAKPDDLGYTPCILPLKVGGSLGKPDASDLQATLLKLAYDRSGAAELVNKLLGK